MWVWCVCVLVKDVILIANVLHNVLHAPQATHVLVGDLELEFLLHVEYQLHLVQLVHAQIATKLGIRAQLHSNTNTHCRHFPLLC